jgi:hypothetical protein
MTDNTDQSFEEIFGPLARHAEYQVGQTIRYRADGRIKQGEIDWISPAIHDHPLEYWLNGFDCIYTCDILGVVDEEQE